MPANILCHVHGVTCRAMQKFATMVNGKIRCAGPVARAAAADVAAAGAWGLLRNALQEFPALRWVGSEVSAPGVNAPALPAAADAFGLAAGGGHWSTPRMLPQSPPQPSTPEGRCVPFLHTHESFFYLN